VTHLVLAKPSSSDVLADAMRGRRLTAFEQRLIQVLHDPIFQREDDLRTSEACALAYRRVRHLRDRLDLDARTLMGDFDRLLALHEWVALVDGTVMTVLTIHYNLCMGTIFNHGEGRAELRPLLNELDSMQSVGVFLATELAYGNNVQALETEALYDHETREFVINTPRPEAQKFMPNTGAEGVAKLGVVLARLKVRNRSVGVFPFIVRIRTAHALCPGVGVAPLGDKPDYALDNAITFFDHVRVPFHHWLGGAESQIDEHGQFTSRIASGGRRFLSAMERVQTGKLCIAAGGLGLLKSSLDLTLRYALQRRTFGPGRRDVSVLQYRTYQRPLFEGIAAAFACALVLQRAALDHATSAPSDLRALRMLAIAKIFISSRSMEVIAQCRERLGAQGLFSANRVITCWIHSNGVVTAEGDNEILLLRMAREMLVGSAYEPPAASEWAAPPLLESPDYLLSLLRERERKLVLELRGVMRTRGQSAMFDAWNELVCDAVELATLHVRRTALEVFNEYLNGVEDVTARDVLNRLLRLLCLKEIAGSMSNLMAQGLVDLTCDRRVASERSALAGSLLADAELLRDAFAIPETLLEAPIAKDYIGSYDRMSSPPPARESGFAVRALASLSAAEPELEPESAVKASRG
jgi:acyl-CoA oxidase